MTLAQSSTRIIDSRHPNFLSTMTDWEKWRLTYRGGEEFRNRYLEQFTTREEKLDYESRKKITPIPSYAKAAINDIRNAIFQRMRDIIRRDGSDGYQRAINGLDLGVDRRGNSMNAFLGTKLLTELLVMGRCGVFVDNSVLEGPSLADAIGARPYLYSYQVEDILSWSCTKPEQPSEFQSVLLRDTCMDYDRRTLLPLQTFQRFRLLWVDQDTGFVNLQFYDMHGKEIDRDGNPSGPIVLELTRIPFVLLDIGDSLIKDVCQHQIALLNLGSSDVNYALKSNFPFYVEQRDLRAVGSHLKQVANPDGTATVGGQTSHDNEVKVGVMQGRFYDIKANPPTFIAPPSEPLHASLELQQKLEEDIRKLVNLSVVSLATRASAESKSLDNQGLESGLSYIGLVLESAERKIAEHWAAYEEAKPSRRQIATIKYPDRYSLKTDSDRIDEATKLSKLMYAVPGQTIKREISKSIVESLIGGKVSLDTIEKVYGEIDKSNYTTSDPQTIIEAVEAGLVGEQTGSMALGFDQDEYLQAREDHALRAARVQAAQMSQMPGPTLVPGSRSAVRSIDPVGPLPPADPAARGVPDLSTDPLRAARREKAASRDKTLRASKKRRVRGKGRFNLTATGANEQGNGGSQQNGQNQDNNGFGGH